MKIAVSACLLGEACRYDGASKPSDAVRSLAAAHELVAVCPEVAGGLPTPRVPSEVVAGERVLRVVNAEGADVTEAFEAGARAELTRIQEAGCQVAVLKAKSPSCGAGCVYDGTFSGALAAGYGAAARALRCAGVRVLTEEQLAACTAASVARHPGALAPVLASSSAECPALETERLVLRALSEADIDDVFAYCSDPDLGFDAGWPVHRTREDARFFVEEVAGAPHVFGIFEKATDRLVGVAGLSPDPARSNPDCLMLGYWLAKQAWGRGYMTEAARELVRYGFEELGLAMITCTHYAFNRRSARVIEKCGFMHEGTLHACECTPDGVAQDVELYYLTPEMWRTKCA